MTVDWKKYALAMQCSREGNDSQALVILAELLPDAESEEEQSAILLGQASCYSCIGELDRSLELIAQAKELAGTRRVFLLQVARGEASVHALKRQFQEACRGYASLRTEYADLIESDPESAIDVDSRFACALVDAQRYGDAIPIFRRLFQLPGLEDLQRLQLYFGIALNYGGSSAEGRQFLFEAAKGSDPVLAESALEHLGLPTQSQ